jgi:hypothetical protein
LKFFAIANCTLHCDTNTKQEVTLLRGATSEEFKSFLKMLYPL